jgi:DNA adenine methylase
MESMPVKTRRRPVSSTRPAAGYVGGKRNLAARLVKLIEAVPHETYAEPFCGMGGVFLRRQSAPRCEVINDASRDVATFFRILQRHFPQFIDTLKFQITSRAAFDRLAETPPEILTDLERAARFLYLQRLAYGGKVSGRNFGVQTSSGARFNINTLVPRLEEIHERLAGVIIECLPYEEFIGRYDKPGTLFYLDPPYWGSEGYYGKELFGREDFARLAALLRLIKGRFILSINDDPGVREVFKGFAMKAVDTTYSVRGGKNQKTAAELIITGGRR